MGTVEQVEAADSVPPPVDPNWLACDADYVLREIARGEIPCAAESPIIAAAADTLLEARAKYADDPGLANRTRLERALLQLMALLCPITLRTLQDTDGTLASMSFWRWLKARLATGYSYKVPLAYRFSMGFICLTVVIVISSLTASYWADLKNNMLLGMDVKTFGKIVAPFTYGAMGACVFLLRALHKHIYERTFDRRRKPEYFNRVLLGAISGGATVLIIQSTGHDAAAGASSHAVGMGKAAEDLSRIGVNALGFLAGYNTDLLFSTIERVTNAIFPKVPTAPAPVTPPPAPVVMPPVLPPGGAGQQPAPLPPNAGGGAVVAPAGGGAGERPAPPSDAGREAVVAPAGSEASEQPAAPSPDPEAPTTADDQRA